MVQGPKPGKPEEPDDEDALPEWFELGARVLACEKMDLAMKIQKVLTVVGERRVRGLTADVPASAIGLQKQAAMNLAQIRELEKELKKEKPKLAAKARAFLHQEERLAKRDLELGGEEELNKLQRELGLPSESEVATMIGMVAGKGDGQQQQQPGSSSSNRSQQQQQQRRGDSSSSNTSSSLRQHARPASSQVQPEVTRHQHEKVAVRVHAREARVGLLLGKGLRRLLP
ncbi:unnamed protein product [Amoebophrya sp. A25]|nr:unnamed protein product [Amoebophrya sp. A25]|eukprot:GSA25T00006375001.1